MSDMSQAWPRAGRQAAPDRSSGTCGRPRQRARAQAPARAEPIPLATARGRCSERKPRRRPARAQPIAQGAASASSCERARVPEPAADAHRPDRLVIVEPPVLALLVVLVAELLDAARCGAAEIVELCL